MSDTPGLDMTTEQYRRQAEWYYQQRQQELGGGTPQPAPDPNGSAHLAQRAFSLSRLGGAVGRGVGRAVNELSNTVVGAGVGLSRHTGVYQLGRDEDEEKKWLEWYDGTKTKDMNPFQIELGEHDTGVYGFIETATQFTAGMVGFGKFLKPVQAFGKLGKFASLGRNMAAGFLTDTTLMDAHEERLSNLVQNGPEWIKNPLTAYLAAEEGDGEVEARFKAGVEGLLTGAAVDGILYGVKALRVARSVKAGKITAEEGERLIAEHLGAAEKAATEGDGITKITEMDDGQFAVALTGDTPEAAVAARMATPTVPEGLPPVAPSTLPSDLAGATPRYGFGANQFTVTFDADVDKALYIVAQTKPSRRDADYMAWLREALPGQADADIRAAGAEVRGRIKELAKNGEGGALQVPALRTPEAATEVAAHTPATATFATRAEAESYAASVSEAVRADARPVRITEEHAPAIREIAERIRSGVDPTDHAKLMDGIDFNFRRILTGDDVKELANSISEAFVEVFSGARGHRSWEGMKKLAREAVPGLDEDDAISSIRELWGDTQNIDARLFAARMLTWGIGQEVTKLSRLADLDPSALRMSELAKGLDTFLNATEALAGSKANVARGLASLRATVEGWVPNGVAAQTAETAAREVDDAAKVAAHEAAAGAAEAAPKGAAAEAGAEAGAAKASAPKRGATAATAEHSLPNAADGPSALPSNGSFPQKAPGVRRSTEGMSAQDVRALARQVVFLEGDPTKILKLLRASAEASDPRNLKDPTFFRKLLGFRVEMMLSGPKTQIINATNNLLVAFQHPTEYWWAGVRSGNKALRDQGSDLFVGNFLYMKDAFAAARKSLQVGGNILSPSGAVLDNRGAAMGIAGLSKLAQVPTKMLVASDEFFKQMQYRSHVRAQSLRLAREQGITDTVKLAERVADDMRFAFDMQGGAVNPTALQHASYATFTNDLGEKTMGKWLQDGANKHPVLGMIFPFVRTPVNIFRFAWERTPGLNRMMDTFQEDLRAGGERAALAKAKSDTGTLMYSMGAALVYGKMMSGGGPKEPKMRQAWLAAGNQPYSITVGGTQISYRRLEPLATPLSLVADFVESIGEMGNDDAEDLIVAIPAALASSVSSKTFLQGMTEFFDAMAGGEPYKVERAMANLAGSFVPNAARQMNPDDVYRETRGILDEIQARIPGLSEGLEPRRNIFGEPAMRPPGYFNRAFNPFTTMDAPHDDVAVALTELGKAIRMPSPKYADGRIDLSDRNLFDNGSGQSPYDRWMELVANPKNGRSLRDDLEDRIHRESWKDYSRGNEFYPGGKAFTVAARLVDAHQRKAFNQMLREYPMLKATIRDERKLKAGSFRSSAIIDAAF